MNKMNSSSPRRTRVQEMKKNVRKNDLATNGNKMTEYEKERIL